MGIGKIRPQILNMSTEKKVEPFSVDFAYTGTVQEYVVPVSGLYKLEVWGAYSPKTDNNKGGYGGYSVGYKKLKKNTVLYIVNGEAGQYKQTSSWITLPNAYNGGGGTYAKYGTASGGGATHIALVSGTLAEIGKDIFDQKGLIVAGGGGGGKNSSGGSGGGISGGNGGESAATGGTQTSGYAFGQGEPSIYVSTYPNDRGGGGGGYFGGKAGNVCGGGGSGWIGGVPSITYKGTTYNSSTSNGTNNGAGKAKISFITK